MRLITQSRTRLRASAFLNSMFDRRIVLALSSTALGGVFAPLAMAQIPALAASASCFGTEPCSQGTEPQYPIITPADVAAHPGIPVNDHITAVEQQTLLQAAGVANPAQLVVLLGKLVLYDRNLSANKLQACASCHAKEAGFTGGKSDINVSQGWDSGTVFYRWGQRKPNSYGYAPFAPVLNYDAGTGQFVGGNFWDLRATGLITGNPSGDQALNPPLDPLEMAMPDQACVVYRMAAGPYRSVFERTWGTGVFAINWPADTATKCAVPQSNEAANPTLPTFDSSNPPTMLDLTAADRTLAIQTFHQMGLSAAAYEASPDVSAFTSKFDYTLKGQATLTAQEQAGYDLFTGQGHCSQCHSASGAQPLFTDWTTANIGLPKNPGNPFYRLTQADGYGFVPNPEGFSYVDPGLGGFLASPGNKNADWKALAPNFEGRFQVATVRNVAKRPAGVFFKDYTHNGYFKDLKDLVHFYNTRDALPACSAAVSQSGGVYPPVGQTCWPASEVPQTVNHLQIGNLGLSSSDEDAIVAFMNTLSDGYDVSTGGN